MAHHERVVVHVDDARVRGDALGYFAGIARGRQARPDVKELPEAGLAG